MLISWQCSAVGSEDPGRPHVQARLRLSVLDEHGSGEAERACRTAPMVACTVKQVRMVACTAVFAPSHAGGPCDFPHGGVGVHGCMWALHGSRGSSVL